MRKVVYGLVFLIGELVLAQSPVGAWETLITEQDHLVKKVMIFSEKHVITATFDAESGGFIGVRLEQWTLVDPNSMNLQLEFDAEYPEAFGGEFTADFELEDSVMTLDYEQWRRIDSSMKNENAGIWTIIGRRNTDGEMQHREVDHPRKRYKILSDARFHWVAFNAETRNFSGTGGGDYYLVDDDYVEVIEFYANDPGYVGDTVRFKMKLDGDTWYHQGLLGDESSLEEVIDEIWVRVE